MIITEAYNGYLGMEGKYIECLNCQEGTELKEKRRGSEVRVGREKRLSPTNKGFLFL